MRLFLVVFLIVFLTVGCDEEIEYHYYLKNSYKKEVNAIFIDYNGEKTDILILSNERKLLHTSKSLNQFRDDRVETEFQEFSIVSTSDTANLNYLDASKWTFKVLIDTQAEYLLVVDSTHFE